MGEPGILKATAIGGFDKKSVLGYIDSLNERFHRAESEYNVKIDQYAQAQESQVAHIKNLEAQLAQANTKLEAIAGELEEERSLALQAQKLIAELDEKNKSLQKQCNDNERELKIQMERARQLQFRTESLEYKSKKYDEVSAQIGDTLIAAKQDASRILANANEQAKNILKQSQDWMKNFYAELGSFKNDSSRLRKSIEEILFVLNDRIDIMQDVVGQVETRFTPQLDYAEEKEPFAVPSDQTGHFGCVGKDEKTTQKEP